MSLSPRSSQMLDEEENVYVITRTGKKELLDPNKITKRLSKLRNYPPRINHINIGELMLKVCQGIHSGITTSEIDEYAGNLSASLSLSNPHYMKLANRIVVDNHRRNTRRSFTDKMHLAYMRQDSSGKITPLLSEEFYKYVEKHQDLIEPLLDYKRDFLMDYFGFRTFQRLYAMKIDGYIIERPQDMYMRAAIAIHMKSLFTTLEDEIAAIKETYDLLSLKYYTQASPTYFNAGSTHPQYSSCFLLGTEDSREGIMNTADESSVISKWGGGIGIHCHCWRSAGSLIRGTNGVSSGIVPFLRIYNSVMRAFNQGGKRLGSAAVYLMPHHPDIIPFLKLILPGGEDIERARDLFYAVWVPDIFMERVRDNAVWSLFDPDEVGDLSLYHNEEYRRRYLALEADGKYTNQIKARDVWEAIYNANVQTGRPYICFSDTVNRMNNQSNIGAIRSSNLCSEIVLYSDKNETAVCNLCSISLSACVKDAFTPADLATQDKANQRKLNHEFPLNPYFDFEQLIRMVKLAVVNLDKIIDKNFYPTEKTRISNMRHRPLGIGMQGLADVFIKLRYPFESAEAAELNKQISETMYFAALSQSTRLCREMYLKYSKVCEDEGSITLPYYEENTYEPISCTYTADDLPKTVYAYPSMTWNGGSPIYNGVFHWEMANAEVSSMYDWETLRAHIKTFGVRNSHLIALMPTASTSQLLGNNECFEPFTSNIYKRKTLAGEFICINKYLINDLFRMKIWNKNIKDYLIALEGSIQSIEGIPKPLKELYKTTWEISQNTLIDLAAARQPFVDQAQSLNLYVENLTLGAFTKLMFRAWKAGLKTGKYYMHMRPAVMPQKFTIDPARQAEMAKLLEIESNLRDTSFMEPMKEVCDLCSG